MNSFYYIFPLINTYFGGQSFWCTTDPAAVFRQHIKYDGYKNDQARKCFFIMRVLLPDIIYTPGRGFSVYTQNFIELHSWC